MLSITEKWLSVNLIPLANPFDREWSENISSVEVSVTEVEGRVRQRYQVAGEPRLLSGYALRGGFKQACPLMFTRPSNSKFIIHPVSVYVGVPCSCCYICSWGNLNLQRSFLSAARRRICGVSSEDSAIVVYFCLMALMRIERFCSQLMGDAVPNLV